MLLALLMTASACGQTPSDTENSSDPVNANTPEVEETETELKDAVPENLTFGGADFTLLAAELYGAPSLVEGTTGEAYNDAIYKMELNTESRLDVKISEVLDPAMNTTAVELVAANDTTYDAFSMTDKDATTVAKQGIFYPMADIPYVALDQIYWGDGLSESLSLKGKYYFAISSFNMYSIERTAIVLMNEAVAARHQIKVPWDEVFSGKWTQDMYAAYDNIATNDVNGDGVMDEKDSYTFGTSDVRDVPEKFLYASGMKLVDIDEDGLPYCSFYGSEKFIDIMEYARNISYGPDCLFGTTCETANTAINSSEKMFIYDRELFSISEFRNLNNADLYRNMESDFSILPMPKYDEAQDRYYSRTCNTIFSLVPVTATDLDKAGAVLEAMSFEGYKTVLPAYKETAMKNKVARNQESADAIQIIYDTRVLDLAKLYLPAHFDTKIFTPLKAGNSIVTMFEEQRNVIETSINDLVAALTEPKKAAE